MKEKRRECDKQRICVYMMTKGRMNCRKSDKCKPFN